jgi:chitin synthase
MGNGRIFDDLHSCNSNLLFCTTSSRFLEYGQVLLVCRVQFFSSNVRGSTRVAQGEGGKTVIISDEGRFDPRSIPKRKWDEYQADMLERNDVARSETSSVTGRQSMRTSMFVPTVDQRGRYSRVVEQQNFYDNPPPRIPANDSRPASRSPLGRESLVAESYVGTQPPKIGGEALEMQETPIHASNRLSRPLSSVGVTDRPTSFAGPVAGLPSDEQLLAEIKRALESADLMRVTKKDVKMHLERVFGVPLDVRREYINQCTEAVLSGRL